MKTRIILSLIALLLLIANVAKAQQNEYSYEFQRGVQAYDEQNYDEAIRFFTKDLEENPSNCHSYVYLSLSYHATNDFNNALIHINNAITKDKSGEKEYLAIVYDMKRQVCLDLADTASAIAAITNAIKLMPDDEDFLGSRAEIYYAQHKYALADADLKRIIEINPNSTAAYAYRGYVARSEGRLDDALMFQTKVLSIDSTDYYAYIDRATVYIEMNQLEKAADDIFNSWLNGNMYLPANANMWDEKTFEAIAAKFKAEFLKTPTKTEILRDLGMMYNKREEHDLALECFLQLDATAPSDDFCYNISYTYYTQHKYNESLEYVDKAINLAGPRENALYHTQRAQLYHVLRKHQEALNEWSKLLTLQSIWDDNHCYVYRQRAWEKVCIGDARGAIDDYTIALSLDATSVHSYLIRGDMYMKLGQKALAEADYKKVLEYETGGTMHWAAFALYALGETQESIDAIEAEIEANVTAAMIFNKSEDNFSYFIAANFYSRIHDKEKALINMQKALDLGFNDFYRIDDNYYLDFIRDTPEFKALIAKYAN
ncbi:MAG: tetratricopeptide repeat protein [Bacteroidales bacterium]|nr:tetratricopeptide repeat protein [Bacteroidales bacterium]